MKLIHPTPKRENIFFYSLFYQLSANLFRINRIFFVMYICNNNSNYYKKKTQNVIPTKNLFDAQLHNNTAQKI